MLRVVHGNRTEALLAALLADLPPLDPFAPHTIVVGGHLVERWLSREIALARGIATGLDMLTFDRFLDRTWAARDAGLVGLDRAQLAVAIAAVLADERVVGALPPVAAYLAAAPGPGDLAGPRRVQLADKLADLAWQYATTRPDWMPALLAGRVPNELAGAPAARWQAALIAEAISRAQHGDDARRCAPIPTLPWARRRAELPPPALAGPVTVFGVSFLSRAQLEALTDLAQATPVTVYLLDPCRELWDDVAGRATASTDPLPLVMWGRPVRDTLAALVERSGGDVDDAFVDAGGATALQQLLADVLDRKAPSAPPAAHAGVTVLACPNPRRELEIVADEVRRRLDADPTLRAHEIAVWLASDAERYLAQAPAAFEALGVPCHLVDAPIDDRGRIGEAVLALLELPTSPMRRRDLLRVLTHPAVLAGYPHVDADDWVTWTERLGIVHGADADAHAGTYLEAHPAHFHWDQGVRRLALGAFMVGDRGVVEIADPQHGRTFVLPEEVPSELQASAATFALLVRSLTADASWLASHEAPLAEWAEVFVGLVDIYLAARNDDAARDLERVRSMLAGLARLDVDGRAMGFREASEHVRRIVDSSRANRGEPLAAGVTVASVTAMRALPFRIAFVVGLAEGGFPAADQPSPLDLREAGRPGDVTPRDRDRHAFLELLLGAREALYLSYVATEDRSGSPLAPSSVVLELADALAPYLGLGSGREALAAITVRHPLHRFSVESCVPAVARERWAASVRDAIRVHLRGGAHPVPDEHGMLALLAHPSQAALREALALVDPPDGGGLVAPGRALTVANLRVFLESPIQAWAQAVLGLDELPDETVVDHSDEPFHVDQPRRAVLLREVLAAWLRDPASSLEARYDEALAAMQLRGEYPVGVFAEAARNRDLVTLERWREHLREGSIAGATRLGFGRALSPHTELYPALAIELSGGRTVRLTGQTEMLLGVGKRTSVIPMVRELKTRSPYHLRGALDHVVLAAAGLAELGHRHILLDRDGAAAEVDHAPWERDAARKFLADLCGELLDHAHGYLLPFEALVKALGDDRPKLHRDKALGYGPIDRDEGLELPRDASQIAQRRLWPLVQRMKGPHGFEGAQ